MESKIPSRSVCRNSCTSIEGQKFDTKLETKQNSYEEYEIKNEMLKKLSVYNSLMLQMLKKKEITHQR